MAGKRGRSDAYSTKIKPRFDEITEWLKLGATEKEIAKNLGVGYTGAFSKYKVEKPEFAELLKKGRQQPVVQIKAAMLKRAIGFTYEETKVTRQKIVFKDDNEEDIPATLVKTEITTKYALPDTAAGLVLLQHWDKNDDGSAKWSRDPSSRELKEKELELKKQQIEDNLF